MTKIGILLIGCAGMAATPGCVEEWSDVDADEAQVAETEVAVTTEAAPEDIPAEYNLIRLVETDPELCLQPRGGSTEIAEVELRFCDRSAPAQYWRLNHLSDGTEIINFSGKCLWNGAPLPLVNGGRPISQRPCNITGTDTAASNALWKPSHDSGLAQLMSRVQRRDTQFCLDVPFGNAFDGATMQMFRCNGTLAQAWILGER